MIRRTDRDGWTAIHDLWADCAKKYGKTFRVHLPFWPLFRNHHMWQTSDPANVEHILKTRFENYIKGPLFRDTFRDLLGDRRAFRSFA